MKNLVKDASMGPLREALRKGVDIANLKKEDMRPVMFQVRMFGNVFVCPTYFICLALSLCLLAMGFDELTFMIC
jgi:hypothetical protein